MKKEVADVINYIDDLPEFDYDPCAALMKVRNKLQSILSKSEDKEDVEFVYVEMPVEKEKPPIEKELMMILDDGSESVFIFNDATEIEHECHACGFRGWLKKVPKEYLSIDAWNWLSKNGERVYSEKGVSYPSSDIVKALKIASGELNKEVIGNNDGVAGDTYTKKEIIRAREYTAIGETLLNHLFEVIEEFREEERNNVPSDNNTNEASVASHSCTSSISIEQKVEVFNSLDDEIREVLYPMLYKLYDEGKLNNGNLPKHREAKDSIDITSFWISGNGNVVVAYDIHWGGDCYDNCTIELQNDAVSDTTKDDSSNVAGNQNNQ